MAGAGNRVVAIDVWRGLALATIFVNHVPGNVLEPYTHKNFGFSDAAELFVLLAGVSVAIVYLPKFADGRWLRETLRIWLRAFHLYTIHLLVLLVCAAIVAFTMLKTGDTRLGEALHFDVLFNRPVEGLLGVATLGLQPSYIDILPLYVVLLLAAPLILIATVASPVLALSLSLAIYAAAALLHLHVPTYPADGHWFFNPLSWQLLFTLGVCLGAMVRAGQSVPANPWLIGLSLAYLGGSALWMTTGYYFEGWEAVPRFLWDIDKSNLSLPRLLHVLALAYLGSLLPLGRWIESARPAFRPLMLMGQHALPVFALGTVLSIAAQMLRVVVGSDISTDMAIIAAGLALQVGLAWTLEWYRAASRSNERVSSAPAVAGTRAA